VAPRKYRDERLAWLAVRDELSKRVHRRRMWDTVFTLGLAPEITRSWESERLSRYSLKVDRLAQKLNQDERRVLRETGQAPAWFLIAVLRR
jgi:hypothetical protein